MLNLVKFIFSRFLYFYFVLANCDFSVAILWCLHLDLWRVSRQVVLELFRFLMGSFCSGGVNHFRNCSTVLFRGKDMIFIYLDLIFTDCFYIILLDLLEEIAEKSQPAVHTVNSHPLKIDVVKVDSMNNFGM